ncbi:MAG: 4-hydroxy-3-methylbut-2-enyl diphosphate reductase, partial [Pseudomonadota bacterium]|nr:4-hydroxy-3-methylbut-2-enyl diphosphate reductase [Pseudomonadota bacterium]
MPETAKPPKTLILANPRGFCAGVDRAIQIVERALDLHGAPVYVRHEIVHNRQVVSALEKKGAVFVDEIYEVPDGVPVIFSAHGVPKSVPADAEARGLNWLDATCPLVSKVHIEAARHFETGRHILLIGHAGHPEVIGTMGQVPVGAMSLIETVADAETFIPPPQTPLAFVTQTTLSVDDTAEIIAVLRDRFTDIAAPHKEDICYATTNRQAAVKEIAPQVGCMLVIGAVNSSNSQRLVDVARCAGAPYADLIEGPEQITWSHVKSAGTIGLTAGASAPEEMVTAVIAALQSQFSLDIMEAGGGPESVHFK